MAVKNKKTKVEEKAVSESAEKCMDCSKCDECGWKGTVGWFVLLFGGLLHMFPSQMATIANFAVYGFSVQRAVGVASVFVALYFLLSEK